MPRHQDSRQRLLEIATELMWESSYGRASVDRICERAGIRKGSFYHHFESKEQLTLEAIEFQWQQYRRLLNEIFSPLVAPLERLRLYLAECRSIQQQMCEKVGFVCGCPLATLGSEIGTQQPTLRAKVHEIMEHNLRFVESAIRDAQVAGMIGQTNPAVLARIVFDFCEGAHTRARIMNDLQPILDLEEGVMTILGVHESSHLATA
jgi:TetR/AcrR family transcriptional regulator, transcriptional repressor for nem operon